MTKQTETSFPQPFYYISFSILNENGEECSFKSLFSNEPGSLKYYLEREIQGFRYGGWGLPRNAQYSIQMTGIEHVNDAVRVKILENGHIIIQGAVSESFLCWANSSRQSTLKGDRTEMNTTALVEFTYNCVAVLKRVIQDCEAPKDVVCDFGFIGMGNGYVLGNGKLPSQSSFPHSFSMNPIGADTETNLKISVSDLDVQDGLAKFTYSILSKIYRMFGFSDDVISYVHAAGKKIDIELIKGIK